MAAERQGESRVTGRTQNGQKSIDSQEGAGQPVKLQAFSVECHRQRITRQPVWTREEQLPRSLSGKLRPHRMLQDSE